MSSISRIRWNGLSLDIPRQWEVIVKDTRHLILEADLRPLLEIRWQPAESGRSAGAVDRIAARFMQGSGCSPAAGSAAGIAEQVRRVFDVQVFAPDGAPGEATLMLVCRTCAATLLVRLYPGASDSLAADPSVLDSLCCHDRGGDRRRWQIQDFFFAVPADFTLNACSFRFGLSTLFFTSGRADLSLCRLAPASEHLKKSTLAALFESLCSAPQHDQVSAGPTSLRYSRAPRGAELLWSAVRRKKSYRAAALTHFPGRDRILGYTMSCRRPIAAGLQKSIENGYGIIEEKETDTRPDP